MEKYFVTYKQAVALKELGFDERCLSWFNWNGKELLFTNNQYLDINPTNSPLKSQVFEWFEKQHQLYSEIVIDRTSYPKYAFTISKFNGNPKNLSEKVWFWEETIYSEDLYRKRDEAESECIDKLIEILF